MEKYHHPWDNTRGDAIALLFFIISVIIVIVLCFTSCTEVNPQRYRGCVVIDKGDVTLRLKLTKHLSDSLHKDYMWINAPKWEVEHYEIGDTIK